MAGVLTAPPRNPRQVFQAAREVAYRGAEEDIREALGLSVRLTGIDAEALAAYRTDWVPLPRPGWPNNRAPDWAVEQKGCQTVLDRFDVAVWSGAGVLCGLAIGRPPRSRAFLRLDLLEGHPNPLHPLRGRVALSAIAAAARYGKALGSTELRLVNPLPAVIPWYERLGFVLVKPEHGAQYCAKGI
jgi:hypothetical protein